MYFTKKVSIMLIFLKILYFIKFTIIKKASGFAYMMQLVYLLFSILINTDKNQMQISHLLFYQAGLDEKKLYSSKLDFIVLKITSGFLTWICIPLILIGKFALNSTRIF